MRVIPVSEWGGVIVDNARLARRPMRGILIHHTAGANRTPRTGEREEKEAAAIARGIQRLHMSGGRGKPWRDTGQHFTISRGGLVLEGRNGSYAAATKGLVITGSHAGNDTVNGTWIGIEWEGLYMTGEPTPAQWAAGVELCARLSIWGKTQASDIEGHRAFRATACPGDRLYALLPKLRASVKQWKTDWLARDGRP